MPWPAPRCAQKTRPVRILRVRAGERKVENPSAQASLFQGPFGIAAGSPRYHRAGGGNGEKPATRSLRRTVKDDSSQSFVLRRLRFGKTLRTQSAERRDYFFKSRRINARPLTRYTLQVMCHNQLPEAQSSGRIRFSVLFGAIPSALC